MSDCPFDGAFCPLSKEEAARALAAGENVTGFLLPTPSKDALLPTVRREGALPRKTFSMGSANEKRYYMEAR